MQAIVKTYLHTDSSTACQKSLYILIFIDIGPNSGGAFGAPPPRPKLSLQTPASNRVMKIETGGGAHLASIGNLLSAPKGPHTSWPKKLHLLQET